VQFITGITQFPRKRPAQRQRPILAPVPDLLQRHQAHASEGDADLVGTAVDESELC